MSIVVVDDSMTNLVVLKHMAKGNSLTSGPDFYEAGDGGRLSVQE